MINRRDLLKLLATGTALPLVPGYCGKWGNASSSQYSTTNNELSDLWDRLKNPPLEAKPGIYWYWMNGNVTKEGIRADLDAIHSAGLSTVLLFSIGGEGENTLISPPANSLTPYWWELIQFAISYARKLGVEITMNACDGWATASGPWIEPENSMQKVTWTRQVFSEGRKQLVLKKPEHYNNYYRDLQVVAFPLRPDWSFLSNKDNVTVEGTLSHDLQSISDPENQALMVDVDEPVSITISSKKPFILRSIHIKTPSLPGKFGGVQRAANQLWVEVSLDGVLFKRHAQLSYPKHGWETNCTEFSHSIKPIKARHVRLVHEPKDIGKYREDMHYAEFSKLQLLSVQLSSRPTISHILIKNAEKWGITERLSRDTVSDDCCVKLDSMVDLSHKLSKEDILDWEVPNGKWEILRIGYTSTGKMNSIAGAGHGLECDKLNRDAARIQFENWFGKALQQVGPEFAGKTLTTFHVDSWEAGSQNWTHNFAKEFMDRRGYSLFTYLPVMTGLPLENIDISEGVLFDIRLTIAELVNDEFYSTMRELSSEAGCVFSGEVVNPTMVADGMDYGKYVDIPMGEFWYRTPQNYKPTDIKEAVSASHIYNRKIAGAEAFTELELKWDEVPWHFKTLGDHHYAEGINRFYLHVYAHQPWVDRAPGMTLMGVGSFFSRTQTWWEPGKAWLKYLTRTQALLQSGSPKVDIAVFNGEDIPARAILPEDLPVKIPFGYKYDSINRNTLLKESSVHGGILQTEGGAKYRILILPNNQFMTYELQMRLKEYIKNGLKVIGTVPRKTFSGRDEILSKKNLDLLDVKEFEEYSNLEEILPEPDCFITNPLSKNIEWCHREGDGWDLYYLSNQTDSNIATEISFRCTGQPYLVDPDKDEPKKLLQWSVDDGRTIIKLNFNPREALIVVLEKDISSRRVKSIIGPQSDFYMYESQAIMLSAGKGSWEVETDTGMKVKVEQKENVAKLPLNNWSVHFPNMEKKIIKSLYSWHESDILDERYFSGTAMYETEFLMTEDQLKDNKIWELDLGEVAFLVEITVNDKKFSPLWKPPFKLDITSALKNKNDLKVAISNTWLNRLVGDVKLGKSEAFVTPPLRFGERWLPKGTEKLLPGGLLGPVLLTGKIKHEFVLV